ncbi:hypothetical protein L204_105575 [Cryptococcus depauperatus]
MLKYAFLTALITRSLLTLPFPWTYFQPDEFYQALEPAHHKVFGYGYLTWEWQDLPLPHHGSGSYLKEWLGECLWKIVAGGRMRSWIWPGVFTGVYQVLKMLRLDETAMLTLAPRFVGVFVAALTDFYTYRVSSKLLGDGSASTALFLSLTSLFNAHLLTRSLSTSPESLLTIMSLYYFPLPGPSIPRSQSLKAVTKLQPLKKKDDKDKQNREMLDIKSSINKMSQEVNSCNCMILDRAPPCVVQPSTHTDRLILSVCLTTLALCIRPTMLTFWAFLWTNLLWRQFRDESVLSAVITAVGIATSLVCTVAASTAFDYSMTGHLYFPILTFIYQNIILNISSFYGSTHLTYHFVQSLPIILFPLWIWWAKGFLSCLLPSRLAPASLAKLDRSPGLCILARAATFSIATLSLSPHSEWRFLHPLLPPFLLFVIPPLSSFYTPTILGAYHPVRSFRQYLRLNKFPFYIILYAGVLPYIYLNTFHGRAQVEVMDVLRQERLGKIESLAMLTPCHSIPWMSHLHKDVDSWFITCEPPVGVDPSSHKTEQDWFYSNPVHYLSTVFPYPPSHLRNTSSTSVNRSYPSHVILFGELLHRRGTVSGLSQGATPTNTSTTQEQNKSVKEELTGLGYAQVWAMWNGFDMLQDEQERTGGVMVWRLA